MKISPVVWYEIYVQDMKQAKKFYSSVFQIEFPSDMQTEGREMWTFPMDEKTYGAGGALVKMDGVPSGGNSTLVYFGCDDCAVEAGRVVKAGGQIFKEKTSIGEYGFIALGIDTEGNMFGMHSMK